MAGGLPKIPSLRRQRRNPARCAGAFLAVVPALAVAAMLAAATIARNRDYGSALAMARATVDAAPNNARAHNNFGNVLLEAGATDRAIEEYRLAIERGYTEAYLGRAKAFLDAGRLDDAIGDCNAAIEKMPTLALAYDNRGVALTRKGLIVDALRNFDTALRLDSDFVNAYFDRAVAYASAREYAARSAIMTK